MPVVKGYYDGEVVRLIDAPTGIEKGDVTVRFEHEEQDKSPKRKLTAAEVAGCLKWDGPAKTLEDMEEGIRLGALESARDMRR